MKPAASILSSVTLLAALIVPAAGAEEPLTLTGNFMSGYQDRVKPLRAVFTATGEDAFDVVFYFNFNGRNHEYRGTAVGALGEGQIEGRVQNESRQRTFTFKGTFEKGVLDGTHSEVTRRGEQKTGTLKLKLPRG